MNLEQFNKLLLESVGVGLAIAEPRSLAVIFSNPRFEEWFPGADSYGASLQTLIPDLDVDKLKARLSQGRDFKTEISIKVGRRQISVLLRISGNQSDEQALLVLEGQNVSKLRELEYMIESYSKMVEKQNRSLQREKERAEKLLLNIMPKKVYEEIRTFGVTTPERFESASVLMLEFVGFAERTETQDPATLVAQLNDIFAAFDQIVEQFGCERIKTIGNAYMAVSGVPEPTPDHAQNIAKVALLLVRYLKRRNAAQREKWTCRVGINTGPVISSIVGVQKYVYDIFGPGVNLAAALQALSEPMEITLCGATHRLIESDFEFEDHGRVEIPDLGPKHVYSLVRERPGSRVRAPSTGREVLPGF